MRALLIASLTVVGLFGAAPREASADAIPPPTRPEWDDPPAPLPPPLEVVAACAVLASGALLVARARRSHHRAPS
ncbi:MAG: hypothetical protein U0271_08035 [Polyangiaceae bacterium]